MGKYDINAKRLALLLLPTFWRKPGFAALAYAAVSPLQWLHTQFVLWKRDAEYRVQKNGQVCHLRAVLNDMFDPIARRITITEEAAEAGALMLRKREEEQALLLPRRETGRAFIINRRGFGGVNGYDFWVNIPIALYGTVDVSRLRAIVGTYKLASRRFSINYI